MKSTSCFLQKNKGFQGFYEEGQCEMHSGEGFCVELFRLL